MTIEGSGLPDRYAVIGDPIAQSRSPVIHRRFAAQTSQNIAYDRIHASATELTPVVDRFFSDGGSGLNVTAPHKHAVLGMADEVSDRARLAGAANTLMIGPQGRLFADNTDGIGLVRDITVNLALNLRGETVLIAGAGGAAAGVIGALLDASVTRVIIANRTLSRAQALAERYGAPVEASAYGDLKAMQAGIVINATAAGFDGDVPALPAAIARGAVCYDMQYSHDDTAFMTWARRNHCFATTCGWGMLVEQAAESFFIWRSVRPDTRPILELLAAGAYESEA